MWYNLAMVDSEPVDTPMTSPVRPKSKAAPDLRPLILLLLALTVIAALLFVLNRPAAPPPEPTPAATVGFEAAELTAPTADAVAKAAPGVRSTPTPTPRRAATATPTRSVRRTATATPADRLPTISASKLPAEARATLRLIEAGGPYPYRQDDGIFGNREGLLPKRPNGYYREYTVETPGSPDRGARRIVAGEGGERYYTDDHYASFRRIIL
jgi:ribonuclease T1